MASCMIRSLNITNYIIYLPILHEIFFSIVFYYLILFVISIRVISFVMYFINYSRQHTMPHFYIVFELITRIFYYLNWSYIRSSIGMITTNNIYCYTQWLLIIYIVTHNYVNKIIEMILQSLTLMKKKYGSIITISQRSR